MRMLITVRWGQFKPSQPSRRVAQVGPNQTVTTTPGRPPDGATSSRPPGANSGCHSRHRVATHHDRRVRVDRFRGGDGLLDLAGATTAGGSPPLRSCASAITGAALAVEMVVICGDRPSRSSARLAILACPNEAPCLALP